MKPEAGRRRLELVAGGRSPIELGFSVAEYLQLSAGSRRTLRIVVDEVAYIDVVEGQVTGAMDPEGEGLEALMRILIGGGLDGTRPARCVALTPPPRSTSLGIAAGAAVLEAARRADEANLSAGLEPPSGEPAAPGLSDLERAVDAVLRRDYEEAVACFRRARTLGEQPSLVEANLRRLAELGFGT